MDIGDLRDTPPLLGGSKRTWTDKVILRTLLFCMLVILLGLSVLNESPMFL